MPSWLPEGNVALASDDDLRLAAKWCSQLVEARGNKPSQFPEGCIPLPSDDFDRLMIKIDILKGD